MKVIYFDERSSLLLKKWQSFIAQVQEKEENINYVFMYYILFLSMPIPRDMFSKTT